MSTRTRVASAASPAGSTIAVKLFGHQQRWLSGGSENRCTADGRTGTVCTVADCVRGPALTAVGARLGGARVQHHVAVGATEAFGTRARIPVRGGALARSSIQARFVGAAVVQV